MMSVKNFVLPIVVDPYPRKQGGHDIQHDDVRLTHGMDEGNEARYST
jgi:hypothetical protein